MRGGCPLVQGQQNAAWCSARLQELQNPHCFQPHIKRPALQLPCQPASAPGSSKEPVGARWVAEVPLVTPGPARSAPTQQHPQGHQAAAGSSFAGRKEEENRTEAEG